MFSQINGVAGVTPFNDWFVPDTTQRHQLGIKITAVDPFWGEGEFIYIKSNDALLKGSLVMTDELFQGALLSAASNTGFPFGVAMAPMASGTYGWIQVAGRAVYKVSGTIAADAALGMSGAGLPGANVAGKQLLNIRHRASQNATKTFTAITYSGMNYVDINAGYDGIFLGMALSGTGIPASTVVAALDPNNKRVTLGSAIGTADKLATASGSITLTGTYTGYGSGIIQYPFIQGAIT